ncbi:MAG TPA: phage holin family protein, partial [Pseudonocardiaceae bacterium]|nr:phage holin family protein [Pseudonocardiaceae bacterium]
MNSPERAQSGSTEGGGADSSIAQLVERMSAQVSALVRDEMALATAEMKRKGAQAGIGLGLGGAGGLLAL